MVIERRKLAIEVDFEMPAAGEGSRVDARFFAIPKKARGLRRGAFAAETSTFRLTGAVLCEPLAAKGSISSSGKDSAVSIMISSQRKPPSLFLTVIGERLARRPLTGMVYDVGEAGVSPLSVKTVLCESSEDEEQNSEGTVGLVGDAIDVSNSDGRRRSGEASRNAIRGDADKSRGTGIELGGAARALSTERGLGGN